MKTRGRWSSRQRAVAFKQALDRAYRSPQWPLEAANCRLFFERVVRRTRPLTKVEQEIHSFFVEETGGTGRKWRELKRLVLPRFSAYMLARQRSRHGTLQTSNHERAPERD